MGVKSVQRLGQDVFDFTLYKSIPSTSSVRSGDLAAWRGQLIADIRLLHCQQMRLVGVKVHNGSGLCFHEWGGEGDNHYESCTVTRGPRPPNAQEDPLFGSNADGFHSTSVRHGPTLLKCRFEYMDDDGIAIQGAYALMVEAKGSDTLIADCRDSNFIAGDQLRIYDERNTLAAECKLINKGTVALRRNSFDRVCYLFA